MPEFPLISCIVPVYNQGLYLRQTLNSILAQTYRPIDVIVVDDGSTDDSAAIAAGFGEPVRVIPQANSGPSVARNTGVAHSRGDYLAFLDGDDLWHETKLARQMDYLQAHPEVEICLTHLQNFWIPELSDEAEAMKDDRRSRPLAGYSFVSALMSRAVFDRVGPVDTSLLRAEDTEWMMRAQDQGTRIAVLDDVLVYRRYHHTNISRTKKDASFETLFTLVKRRLDRNRD